MKKIIITLFIIILGNIACVAQNDFRKEFEKFMNQTRGEFNDFKQKCNKEYADHLRSAWESFNSIISKPIPKDTLTIPPVIYTEEDTKEDIEEKEFKNIIIADTITKEDIEQVTPLESIIEEMPKIEKTPEEAEEPIGQNEPVIITNGFSFVFYGTTVNVSLGEEHKFTLNNCNNESVASTWEFCSGVYADVAKECIQLKKKYNLCDWGYLQMIKKMSEQFFGKQTNEATLITSFIYCQSGYKTKMGISNGRLYLLVASEHMIYGERFFNIKGEKFYPIDCDEEEMNICKADFPNGKPMSLWISEVPALEYVKNDTTRTLKSKRFPEMNISVSVNKNLMDFYSDYPISEFGNDFMTKWIVYANTPLEKNIKEQIYPALKECLKEKTLLEQVNMLLNFVQTAFVYEYDENVWGYDRSFFAEETLYYDYCDCEDRSILFSRFVRDLTGLKVLLIYYPGHIATAVCIDNEAQGDYLEVENEKFTICDPTYINAPVGKSMPELRNSDIILTLLK